MKVNKQVQFRLLKELSYKEVWVFQKTIQQKLIRTKLKVKRNPTVNPPFTAPGQLIFCEHKPVFTLGKSGSIDHLISSKQELADQNIEFFKINRGGDITYHGPGQITGYLILDLDNYYHDVHKFVRDVEESIIQFLSIYNISGKRLDGFTGVWIEDEGSKTFKKICAIGIHMSRWVSLHGFGLNILTELDYFKRIIPCGIDDENKAVTTLSQELDKLITIEDVVPNLKNSFSNVFGFEYIEE